MLDIKLRFGFQPPADHAGALFAIGRPRFREAVIGNVVALYAGSVLDEPRLGSPIWRYELLEARRAVQSSAASVTQTPHSWQP